MTDVISEQPAAAPRRTRNQFVLWVIGQPWWLFSMLALGAFVLYQLSTNATYGRIFTQLQSGIQLTLFVSFTSYILAMLIGLFLGIVRSYRPNERMSVGRVILYHACTFYVELFRGLPVLVVLLIMTFVAVPSAINGLNALFSAVGLEYQILARNVTYTWRAIIGLGLTYGAFLSEVFRAGIQSVDRGQREAAAALGLNAFQVLRFVVLPQATRRVLPPLGNDFIAMIKDSSLVAILGVRDITQISKLSAGQSFLYLETYLIAASIYLLMTVIGSLMVQGLERYLNGGGFFWQNKKKSA